MKHKLLLMLTLLLCAVINGSAQTQSNDEQTQVQSAIMTYLNANQTRLNLSSQDISSIIVTNQFESKSTGLTHVYLNQAYQGKAIFNAISSVALKDDEVFYFANRFISNVEDRINATSPVYAPEAIIQRMANEFNLGSIQGLEQKEVSGTRYTFNTGGISQHDITVELVYAQVEDDLKLAWHLTIYKPDNTNWWSLRVDALTGELIEANDLILTCQFENAQEHIAKHQSHNQIAFFDSVNTASAVMADGATYNVFPLPVESPNHGTRQLVTTPANPEASPFGWHDTDGLRGADETTTRGNNVFAKEDVDGLNEQGSFGVSPDGTSTLSFDFPLDFSQAPINYQSAAITNLFYTNNMMHDIWFNHGFDEVSGNFQGFNYSGLGFGNDFVIADGQDGSGLNNANFGTPVEGFSPRMQMFLWGSSSSQLNVLSGSVAGTYTGTPANFGQELTSSTSVTGTIALVEDTQGDPLDFCESLSNPTDLNGKIAIIRRGTCEFGFKVQVAQNAGAIAAIVVNNVPGGTIAMAPGASGAFVNIPSLMINQADGEAIIAALQNGETINVELSGPDASSFIDSNFDNVIIAHEYGHGISNRLTGGANQVGCLFNDEQMGEGWSDWFGLIVTMTAADVPETPRGIGTYAIGQPTDGLGIRPRRYSPDFTVNELTYAVTNNTALSQPHGIGSVWATVLWDLTWAYIEKYGFDADLYNGTGGNNRIMQLVIDGLKLQPCEPGFVDGRNALLAADLATTGGEDQCMIWEVFAARGLGYNAQQGSTQNREDQVEDFSMPPTTLPSLANCSSLSTTEFTSTSLKVYPNPTETELIIQTPNNLGEVTISLMDINGRIVFRKQTELFNSISINTSGLNSGLYILNITGDGMDYNEKIVKQ
jgi:extracellular elastinolytic metalloproteinase